MFNQIELSRRSFLKGAGAAAAEIAFRPVGQVVESMSAIGLLPEGHPIQRAAVLENIGRTLPFIENGADREDLLPAWLKFNLAEIWGKVKGYDLASILMRHDLYSNGKVLDITKPYVDSVLKKNKDPDNPQENPEQTLARFIGMTLSDSLYDHLNIYPHDKIPDINNPDGDISLQTVVGPIYHERVGEKVVSRGMHSNIDHWYSLKRYTIKTTGKLKTVEEKPPKIPLYSSPEKPNPYKRVIISTPQVQIYDRYHWSDSFGVDQYVGSDYPLGAQLVQLLRDSGISPDNPTVFNFLVSLNRINLNIGRPDGILLTKYGFAHDFDIVANLSFPNEDLIVDINNALL